MAWKVAFGLVVAGLAIGLVGGIGTGSILGAVVAGAAVVPAGYAAWKGIQEESQWPLVRAILVMLLGLGIAALLVLLRVVDWLR
jgi:hypothetical protein